MKRGIGAAAYMTALVALVAACDSSVTEPVGDRTALAIDVEIVGTADQVLEGGMVRLRGPTDRNVSINPGETREITGLQPGSYSVALEGRVGGDVQLFGERTNVNVVAEQITPVTVQLSSFVPTVTSVPTQFIPSGVDFTVEWSTVQGAENYQIEASETADFSTILFSQATSSTSFVFTATPGTYYFRVRAINRFDARGVPSAPSAGVAVLATIEPNQSLTGSLDSEDIEISDGSFIDPYFLILSSSTTIRVDLTSSDFDTYLFLTDTDFNTLAENDDTGSGTNSQIETSLGAGTYMILVNSFGAGETGAYQLSVVDVNSAAVGGPAMAGGQAPSRAADKKVRIAPTRSLVTHPPVSRSSGGHLRPAGEKR